MTLPPPTQSPLGGPPPYEPPTSPTAPRKHRWWIPVVIVVPLLIVAIIVAGSIGIAQIVSNRFPIAPDQPLADGSPGEPIAVTPMLCEVRCFVEESAEGVIAPERLFTGLGVPDATFPAGTYTPTPAQDLFRSDKQGWSSYEGDPDSCFFALANSPIDATLDSVDATSDDPVIFIGTHEDTDRLDVLDQTVRIFDDSASAEAHMTALAGSIAGCQTVEIGPASDRYIASISNPPALGVPDSVAAVGWVRTGDPGPRWRAYVFDLQRGNLVLRVRLLTDGGITEAEFREFAEACAVQLGELTGPGAGGT